MSSIGRIFSCHPAHHVIATPAEVASPLPRRETVDELDSPAEAATTGAGSGRGAENIGAANVVAGKLKVMKERQRKNTLSMLAMKI